MFRTPVVGLSILAMLSGVACGEKTFQQDLAFLEEHTAPVVLTPPDNEARIVVSPTYQGRVMTSTPGGSDDLSFGWINYELVASGQRQERISVFGGEDRFWLGPEGGQYSLFFEADEPFDLDIGRRPARWTGGAGPWLTRARPVSAFASSCG